MQSGQNRVTPVNSSGFAWLDQYWPQRMHLWEYSIGPQRLHLWEYSIGYFFNAIDVASVSGLNSPFLSGGTASVS